MIDALRLYLVFLVVVAAPSINASADTNVKPPHDGFCGSEALRYCLSRLDKPSVMTESRERVDELPIVSFRLLREAAESCGLSSRILNLDEQTTPYLRGRLNAGPNRFRLTAMTKSGEEVSCNVELEGQVPVQLKPHRHFLGTHRMSEPDKHYFVECRVVHIDSCD